MMYNYIIICSPSSHWNFKSWLRRWRNLLWLELAIPDETHQVCDIPTVHNCHNLPSGYDWRYDLPWENGDLMVNNGE